jgi:hypothetical protein
MPCRQRLSVGLLGFLAIVVVGCGAAPSQSPSVAPNLIQHATGATDVVLRFEEAGGFLPPGFFVSQGPAFTLYGDGTAIFRDPTSNPPEPIGKGSPGVPYAVVRLSEDQVQALLQFAIGPGGLAVAKASYERPIADAPTATFTIVANGQRKTVSVNGLGLGSGELGPDENVLNALVGLKTRLTSFGTDVAGEAPWVPERYRGVLIGDGFPPAIAWPWPQIRVEEFVEHRGPNDPPFRLRTLTPADAAALGVKGFEAGVTGLTLQTPDAKLVEFGLRPLWPEEAF